MKVCSKCKIEKEFFMFGKDKRTKDRLCCYCKECIKEISKIYNNNNKRKIRKRGKQYRDNNKDKIKKWHKIYRDNNKAKIKKQDKIYYLAHLKERKRYNKKDWLENKEYYQKYRKENKERIRKYKNAYCRNRRKNDIEFKILCNLRRRVSRAIKNNRKHDSTKNLLGCSIEFLKHYLQSQFKSGMTWANYGTGWDNKKEWQIDHIKPCASFDLSKPEEQKKCFHYTNLQPLWAIENLSKGKKHGNNS